MSRALSDLTAIAKSVCEVFLTECRKAGHPVMVVQTYRSVEEQEALYAKGRSRPGPKVTDARGGDSFHNFRCAWDVCFVDPVMGKLTWEGPWDLIGNIGEKLNCVWGGHFEHFPDRPHFEYHPGETLAQMRDRAVVRHIS